MKIIRYFCSVKEYNTFLRNTFLAIFAMISVGVMAQGVNVSAANSADSVLLQMDDVEVSLLTCSPGQKVWSLYGHTAIRYNDKAHDVDLAINYGIFNFRQKNFVLKFVFGHTDYEMGIEPFSMFLMEYAREGRGVVQQKLNLSREEKFAITQALSVNYQPENRIYRYNYFYNNCTTKARDILVNHLDGKVEYPISQSVKTSWRNAIHQLNEKHLWARFGNDLLLGVKADGCMDYSQRQFVPDTLRKDFGEAAVVDASGRKRALVLSTVEVLKPNEANVHKTSGIWDFLSPNAVFSLLLAFTIAISVIERRRGKTFWLYDVILLTLDGLAGLCLLAMVFSEHPTVGLNFQILLLNPLSIMFVYFVGNGIVQQRYHRYWSFMLLCLIVFFIGGFFQDYADGMYQLACILLIRCFVNKFVYTIKR